MPGILKIEAPCKINLRLEVLGKRPDGYHEVRLLMVAISLYDHLELEQVARGISLSSPGLPEGPENLAWRAAALFFETTGVSGGVRIRLDKKVPTAAGLGGGSSDAAAVLGGLDRMYGTGLGVPRLRELGARLGSDVPFFMGGAPPAWALGRGERIYPLSRPIPEVGVALVNPRIPVPTPEVYKALGAGPLPEALTSPGLNCMDTPLPEPLWGQAGREFLRNDLETAVFGRYPRVKEIKQRLLEAGAGAALMSGSGSSVFGICRDQEEARRVLDRARFPADYFLCAARTLAHAGG